MYFCDDAELLAWEPGIFTAPAFAHQAIVKEAAGTLTGTSLVMGSAVLGDVEAGMVMQVSLADDSLAQLVEVAEVADATHATVSALRGRSTEEAVAPLVTGSVKVTVVTFRPQIGAVGDSLLASLGVASDRGNEAAPLFASASGFRPAAVFATLAAVYRAISEGGSSVSASKRAFYEGLAQASRVTISAKVDLDGDGVAEAFVSGGVREWVRS